MGPGSKSLGSKGTAIGVFLSWIKWAVMSRILPEGSSEFGFFLLGEASAPRMSLQSGLVQSGGLVLVGPLPLRPVPVGPVPLKVLRVCPEMLRIHQKCCGSVQSVAGPSQLIFVEIPISLFLYV